MRGGLPPHRQKEEAHSPQNGRPELFAEIAEACAPLQAQLGISLGNPTRMPLDLPGEPIVVPDAPHQQLIERATLVISHAGLNNHPHLPWLRRAGVGDREQAQRLQAENQAAGGVAAAALRFLPIFRTLPLNGRQGDWGEWPWWMTSYSAEQCHG